MCHLMAGYQGFLRPIKSAPSSAKATDTGNLYDLGGFLRSRDKSGSEFFKRYEVYLFSNLSFVDSARRSPSCDS